MRTRLRVLSFLGQAAAPHYRAVAAHVARAVGVGLDDLREPALDDLARELAGGPALLFLCGLPYVRARDAGADVVALAAPVPPGRDAPVYGADLVARAGGDDLAAALRRPRIGFNGRDSLSGWVLPRHGIAALGLDPDAVGWVETGSHARSLRLLIEGELDAAPIDSSVLVLERRLDAAVAALPTIGRLGEAPSPPVCAVGVDDALAGALRAALAALHEDADGQAALALGGVARLAPVEDGTYDPVRRLDTLGRPYGAREER